MESSAGATRVKRFTVAIHPESRTETEVEDGLKDLEKIEDDNQETKSVKYWAERITCAFRSLTVSPKQRKNSFGSLLSSLETVQEIVLEFLATHISSCLRPSLQKMKEKIQQQQAQENSRVEEAANSEFDEMDGPQARFKPEAIDTLCQLTKFNKRELQLMYRGFKQECPSGMVREETFKGIYAQYFPKGADTSQYAHYVFNTFDQDHTGAITFTDFVIGLSVLARGSLQEKLRWVFSLYDINGDGYITKDEMSRIVAAIYDMMGKTMDPPLEEFTTRDHVERVFQKLDQNKDGVVTIEEFMDSCSKDEHIKKSMTVFNTVL